MTPDEEKRLREVLAEEIEAKAGKGDPYAMMIRNSGYARIGTDVALAAMRRVARPTQSWLPIGSAPKDGTDIILFGACRHDGDARAFAKDANIGWWSASEWRTRTNEICDATYWQPLPPAPGEEAEVKS